MLVLEDINMGNVWKKIVGGSASKEVRKMIANLAWLRGFDVHTPSTSPRILLLANKIFFSD